MAISEAELINLLCGLTATDAEAREATCGTITDWLSAGLLDLDH
jgi:hypothetical protein